MATYPGKDIEREAALGGACPCTPADAAARAWNGPAALIADVDAESPADDAGFEPGCYLTSVDGQPLRDIIDWRWLSADDAITVGYIDLDGEAGEVELEREEGESWGFAFEGVVFDAVKLCRNACIFCFMRQLPEDARASLSLRDDDFRLSFLAGTFVTLTNLSSEDEARIIEQHISPLRVSLHASNAELRRRMIGRHADHGLAALERLLAAGIQVHAQIVLMPGVNDGQALRETLAWAYAREGINGVGIVPLGYTKHQEKLDHSFSDPKASAEVIRVIEPFQERARAERGTPWVFAADEFYVNAYGAQTPERIPPASDYGDYDMFEDGIGIVRSYVEEFNEACASGLAERAARLLDERGVRVRYIVGEAMQPFLDRMLETSPLAGRLVALTVGNDYFGGNVNVTGLLCGCDIARAVRLVVLSAEFARELSLSVSGQKSTEVERRGDAGCADRASSAATETAQWAVSQSEDCLSESGHPASPTGGEPQKEPLAVSNLRTLFVIPKVILNDQGITLDDMTVQDMEKAAGVSLHVVSCNPQDYLPEIIELASCQP